LSRFSHHVFVCTNTRPEGGRPACAGTEIFAALQQNVARHPELWDRVAVTATGCLGPCFDGPTVVVYPEGVWYAHVRAEDAAEIVEQHLAGGRPIERLRYQWPAD
jgi:(2Fe-2S) ferredoxin